MNFRRELDLAIDLARRAGERIRALHGSGLAVDTKDDDSPVTQADREANALIVAALTAAFPDDGILSEELPDDGSRMARPRVWMVDPLDGTKDFIRGRDGFAVMIGLLDGATPGARRRLSADRRQALLRHPRRRRLRWSRARRRRAERIHVSDVRERRKIRMVASKSHRTEAIDRVRAELGISDELNVGSVGLKLGLIAEGERDLYVNPARPLQAVGRLRARGDPRRGRRAAHRPARASRSTTAAPSSATCAGSSPRTASRTTRSCDAPGVAVPGRCPA